MTERYVPGKDSSIFRPEQPQSLEGRLWVSPDIGFVNTFTLEPGERRKEKIQLTHDSIPKGMALIDFLKFRESPRSRYGQVFVEIEGIASDLYDYFLDQDFDSFGKLPPELLQPEVTVINYAKRSNTLRAGGGVFRMYIPNGRHLTGDALLSSGVRINGEPLTEENLGKNREGRSVALRMTLDRDSRVWIEPGDEPINIDPFNDLQRDQMKPFLVPTPIKEGKIPYLIYSTEELSIPKGMYGIVRRHAYHTINGVHEGGTPSVHGNSQLFDGGRTWNMVFELHGPTVPGKEARYIEVDLFETAA